jgi:hypothetical protein
MKFEQLIWKYLDSELTIEEDKELRKFISDDPLKKAEFEEYIELNYLLKKDANVNLLTKKEVKVMEDNILMHIINEQSTPKVFDLMKINLVYSAVASILIFFIASNPILEMQEKNYDIEQNNFMVSIPQSEINKLNNSLSSINNNSTDDNNFNNFSSKNINSTRKSNNENVNQIKANIDISYININVTNNDDYGISSIEDGINNYFKKSDESILDNNIYDKNLKTLNDISYSDIILSKNQSYINTYQTEHPKLLSMNYYNSDLMLKDIAFESNVFTDISRTGFRPIDNKKVSSFAQTVSVKITENSRFGVEFGLSEYQFNMQRNVVIPYGSTGINGSDPDGRRLSNGILTQIESEITYNVYFASLFFDKTLLKSQYFNLNGRLGLGVSNGGILSTGRVYAEIPIFGPLNYITGIDLRLFQNDNIFYNLNGRLNTNVSFINGLYINF